jgi:hypothetical protein
MSTGTPLVAIMLIGWFPIVCVLFALLPARRAVIAGFIFAWLFLPITEYQIRYFPEYNKMSATSMGVFFATLVFDPNRLLRFRPKLVDVPMAVLCAVPFLSSISNGLGAYDGLSESFGHVVMWGLPYFIGRIYLNDLRGLRELAVGIFIGGLVYVPFCLYEHRMSPQLHKMFYGYFQHSFVQQYRWGGWRPMVFMEHGLMVGMWMAVATLIGIWLWYSGGLKRLYSVPTIVFLPFLILATILTKSSGAVFLLALGLAVLGLSRMLRSYWPLYPLAALPVIYILLRGSGLWQGHELIDLTDSLAGPARAQSIAMRVYNENMLAERALERPLLGWGGWGRNRVRDAQGRDISITDGQWVITLGINGIVGLTALLGTILLPALLLRAKIPKPLLFHPAMAPAFVMAVVLLLWMIDNLPNAMRNPIFLLMAGGLAGLNAVRVHRVARFTPRRAAGLPPHSVPLATRVR